MIINVNSDIIMQINKQLCVNDVLLLRKSFKNNYKIMKEFDYIRLINPESDFYINENDNYNVELNINDYMLVYNKTKLLKYDNIIGINIKRTGFCNFNNLDVNFDLKELIYELLCKDEMKCLCVDIGYFYSLSYFFRKRNKDITKLNITTLCFKPKYDLIDPYWDLTLYYLKQVVNTFKYLENIIYINLKLDSLFYNIYKLNANIVLIYNLENYNNYNKILKYYLKKKNININLTLNFNNKNYNLFFEKDNSLKLDILNNTNM